MEQLHVCIGTESTVFLTGRTWFELILPHLLRRLRFGYVPVYLGEFAQLAQTPEQRPCAPQHPQLAQSQHAWARELTHSCFQEWLHMLIYSETRGSDPWESTQIPEHEITKINWKEQWLWSGWGPCSYAQPSLAPFFFQGSFFCSGSVTSHKRSVLFNHALPSSSHALHTQLRHICWSYHRSLGASEKSFSARLYSALLPSLPLFFVTAIHHYRAPACCKLNVTPTFYVCFSIDTYRKPAENADL